MTLPAGDARRLRLAPGTLVQATEGVLWLTVTGQAADHVLRPGEAWMAEGQRGVVVQAVGGEARFSCWSGAALRRPA